MNKVIITGNVVRDAELKSLPSGTQATRFSVAVNIRKKQANGEWSNEAHFFDCDAFGATANTVVRHFPKGKPILVEGSLRQQTWETNTGEKRTRVGILVDRVEFIGAKNAPDQDAEQQPLFSRATPRPAPSSRDTHVDYEDVPF